MEENLFQIIPFNNSKDISENKNLKNDNIYAEDFIDPRDILIEELLKDKVENSKKIQELYECISSLQSLLDFSRKDTLHLMISNLELLYDVNSILNDIVK